MTLFANRILFTNLVDKAIEKNDLTDVVNSCTATRKQIITALRGELTDKQRNQYSNLNTLYQEFEDLLAELKTSNDKAAIWKNEFKQYRRDDGTFYVKCGDHEFTCGDAFAGFSMLATTLLTRQVRAAILDCIINKKIYAGVGPAGTGKTETCKDTLRMLGYEEYVHISSDNNYDKQILDIKTALLDKSKNAVIFDEFNRFTKERQAEVLGLVKKAGFWTFVTYNPGYEGRYQLDGLANEAHIKMDFTVPQRKVLMKSILGAQGFLDYNELGPAFADFNSDCEKELTKCRHYDFGLRMLLSSAKSCGRRLKNNPKPEKQIMGNFLYELLQHTCIKADQPKVMELLKKHFCAPDAETLNRLDGCAVKGFVGAILGNVRHGVAIVGDLDANAFKEVQTYAHENWGFKPQTVEWGTPEENFGPNGKVTNVFRQAVATGEKCAVYISGPISNVPGTIEHLNTVLDDNRCMVFENGERLDLKNVSVVCLFSEKDVDQMSPAFNSRNGWVVA